MSFLLRWSEGAGIGCLTLMTGLWQDSYNTQQSIVFGKGDDKMSVRIGVFERL